jgi:hypothetical protein
LYLKHDRLNEIECYLEKRLRNQSTGETLTIDEIKSAFQIKPADNEIYVGRLKIDKTMPVYAKSKLDRGEKVRILFRIHEDDRKSKKGEYYHPSVVVKEEDIVFESGFDREIEHELEAEGKPDIIQVVLGRLQEKQKRLNTQKPLQGGNAIHHGETPSSEIPYDRDATEDI